MNFVLFAKSLSSIGTCTMRRTLVPSAITTVKHTISCFSPLAYNTLAQQSNIYISSLTQHQYPYQLHCQHQQYFQFPKSYSTRKLLNSKRRVATKKSENVVSKDLRVRV